MSVEAVAWAFRQQLPPKPKILLLTLADQTDERTGKVCYGKVDVKHLASKCSIGERTLYRYLAGLIRNGYVIRESGKARGHENELWLRLDRVPSKIEEWQWSKEDDPQDVAEGSANLAEGKSEQNGIGGMPQDGRPEESLENQRTSRAREKPLNSFSRDAQDVAVEAAKPKPLDPHERVPVLEGTSWWAKMETWWRKTHGRSLPKGYNLEGAHRGKTGRHFRRVDLEAAGCQRSTGPPSDPLSDESVAELKATG